MNNIVRAYRAPLSPTSIKNLQSIVGASIVSMIAPSGTLGSNGIVDDLPSVSLRGAGRSDWLNIQADLKETTHREDYAQVSVETARIPLWIDFDEHKQEINGNHIALRAGTEAALTGITVHEWRGGVSVVGPEASATDERISFDRLLEFECADGCTFCIGTSGHLTDAFAFAFGAFGAGATQEELGAYRARLRIEKDKLINDSEHRRSN